MNIESLISWKQSKETKEVLASILAEIQSAKNDLTRGTLIRSPELEREYCHSIGYIKGLQFIENLLKEGDEDGRVEFE